MKDRKSLVKFEPKNLSIVVSSVESEALSLIERRLESVREEMQSSPYIEEALRVLPVGGYRSAIGSFWNAVVDDLRNKVTFRSLSLFNKSINIGREIKSYEDFQSYVNDDQLIDGAYKIGVIGWEASRVLSPPYSYSPEGRSPMAQPSLPLSRAGYE